MSGQPFETSGSLSRSGTRAHLRLPAGALGRLELDVALAEPASQENRVLDRRCSPGVSCLQDRCSGPPPSVQASPACAQQLSSSYGAPLIGDLKSQAGNTSPLPGVLPCTPPSNL